MSKPEHPRRIARAIIDFVLRLILGGVFIWAGVLKAADPGRFLIDIRGYDLLGDPWAPALALGLPWLEIFAGLGVVTRKFYPGSLTVLLGLTVVFLIALSSAWVRGLDITCGCFGEQGTGDSNYSLWIGRDLALMATAAALVWLEKSRQS